MTDAGRHERAVLGTTSVLAALVVATYALALFPSVTITACLVFSAVTIGRWIWRATAKPRSDRKEQ